MNVYIAGPMRGKPALNRPAFLAAAVRLRALGHNVFNPGEQPDAGIRANLAVDMAWICAHADIVALLPGWEDSRGATTEAALALALGIMVGPVESFLGEPLPIN